MSLYSKEFLSSSSLISYPFEDDAGVPVSVSRLFCDAILFVPYGQEFSGSISSVFVDDSGLSFLLSVCGDTTNVDLSFENNVGCYAVVRNNSFSLVVDMEHARDSIGLDDDSTYPLSVSCANFGPRSVSSISLMKMVERGEDPVFVERNIQGDIVFVNGTNSKVVSDGSSIEFNAIPGAGEGIVPCDCGSEESDDQSRVPTIVPESTGDVVVDGDGCIQVNTDNQSVISIEGRCTACCPTSKYSEQLDKLSDLKHSISEVHSKALSFSSKYNTEVSKFNASLEEPIDSELIASITMMPTIPRDKSNEWINSSVKGKHQKIMSNTNIVNASQKTVMVDLYVPTMQNMSCVHFSVSVTAPVGDTPLTEIERDVINVNQTRSISLPPGGSLNAYAIFRGAENILFLQTGTYEVHEKVVFSWVDSSSGAAKSLERNLAASCSIER